MVKVTLTSTAARQLQALPRPILARMIGLMERLERWPEVSGAKRLSGRLAGRWRMRTGDYRMQFIVESDEVIIERIGHRDSFYED